MPQDRSSTYRNVYERLRNEHTFMNFLESAFLYHIPIIYYVCSICTCVCVYDTIHIEKSIGTHQRARYATQGQKLHAQNQRCLLVHYYL